MYPWDVLGVEPTDDKKVIKKAYAKLIRQYRPNETPEEFQEINQAYQNALALLQLEHLDVELQSVNPGHLNAQDDVYDPLVVLDSNATDQTDGQTECSEKANIPSDEREISLANSLVEQFDQMVVAEFRIKSVKGYWEFLNRYHEIQDLQLRDSLSKEVFKRLAEYNLNGLHHNGVLLVEMNDVRRIAEILEWEENWKEYSSIFPPEYMSVNYAEISENKKSSKRFYHVSYAQRAFSLYVDIIVFAIVVFILDEVTIIEPYQVYLGVVLARLIQELSPMKRTIGAIVMRFEFYDKKGNVAGLKHILVRNVGFNLFMLPFFLPIWFEQSDRYLFPTIIFYLLVFWIFYNRRRELPQDYLSGLVAVMRK